jgi:CBS-domain-containing membrane protein
MTLRYNTLHAIGRFIGLETNKTGHLEKWVSGIGGLAGILAVTLISQQYLQLQEAAWIVASMGATAVLVFAVPHGPLSQPWAVIGGHAVSAVIGVACARWVPIPLLAPALAVALAIGSMHYLRCIHPPGGATALAAVVGGANLQAMGFQFVLTPVLLNAITMVAIAILFNYGFRWRRYPAALGVRHVSAKPKPAAEQPEDTLSEQDLEKALAAMNSTIDISGQDLVDIYRLARQNKNTSRLQPDQLELGHYYSNGLYGEDWQVRQIIDMPSPMTSPNSLLIYKVVAGASRRSNGSCSFEDFARWASYQVFLNENSWQRRDIEEVE